MAKTKFSIILDYHNAMKQAEELDSIAEELSKCKGQTDSCNERIRSSWSGDNANKYLSKMNISSQDISKIRKNIIDISNTIKRIAKRTYDTEMAALEISQKRTY